MSGSSSSSSSGNQSGYTNTGTSASQATVPTWQATYQPTALTGYTPTVANQTGGIESKPSWMSGVWDADWWGKNASTGQTMTNADLAPKNNNSLLEAIYNSGASTNSPQTTQATQAAAPQNEGGSGFKPGDWGYKRYIRSMYPDAKFTKNGDILSFGTGKAYADLGRS